MSFAGPEGDEARVVLKELRIEQQSKSVLEETVEDVATVQSVPSTEKKKATNRSNDAFSISPLFSPWKRLSHDSGSHHHSQRRSAGRVDRESTGSAMSRQSHDPFERYADIQEGDLLGIRTEDETHLSVESDNRL